MPLTRKRKSYKRRGSRRYRKSSRFCRAVRSCLRKSAEKKHFHQVFFQDAISSSWSNWYFSGAISQGSGIHERVGNTIRVTGLYAKLTLARGDNTNVMRMLLYIPKNLNYNLPNAPGQLYAEIDPKDVTVLVDRIFYFNTDFAYKTVVLKHRFKGFGMLATYNGTTGSTLTKNDVRLSFLSDSSLAPDPIIDGYLNFYFTDV